MVRRVDAIFTQGTLRPLEPLALPEGARVHLSVETDASTDALPLPAAAAAKLRTPRLANPKDAADFVMEIREGRDAGV